MSEESFSGAVCFLKYDKKCSYREPNTYYQDPNHNGTLFFCKEKELIPVFCNCPLDMHFEIKSKSCASEYCVPKCAVSPFWLVFSYPKDCKKYYTCDWRIAKFYNVTPVIHQYS